MTTANQLADWRSKALQFEQHLNLSILGQCDAIRAITIAVFARGHVLLEGNVGVGKTTLLRAVAQLLGGYYQRIEGTIDLMPADLVYYTYLNNEGKPQIDPGPLLKQGDKLATFFFNEINRARPQVHSLLLRAMAERSVSAFNRDYHLPHLQVIADRNRVEREETFELPAAAKDRFMLEINIDAPAQDEILDALLFDTRFHDTDHLIAQLPSSVVPYYQLNDWAQQLQNSVQAAPKLREYALLLWKATQAPQDFKINLPDIDVAQLLLSGISPRGMSYWIRAAKVRAWLEHRVHLLPEDLQATFALCIAHRLFLNPIYAYRRAEVLPALLRAILHTIAAP